MTREQKSAKMQELRESIEANILAYNGVNQEGIENEAKRLDVLINEDISDYNDLAKKACFEDCLTSENPMSTAVTTFAYVTIKTKDSETDLGIPVRTLEETSKQINLIDLWKSSGKTLGANPSWVADVDYLCNVLAARQEVRITNRSKHKSMAAHLREWNDCEYVNQIAKSLEKIENGDQDTADPLSKSQILKTLDKIVKKMMGEKYIAITHDVNYLLDVSSKKGKKTKDKKSGKETLGVRVSKSEAIVQFIMDILYTKLTGAEYGVEVDKKKA